MTIPNQVKIAGRIVQVHVSARGYVEVGQSRSSKISSSDIPEAQWHASLYACFEEALQDERRRIHELKK